MKKRNSIVSVVPVQTKEVLEWQRSTVAISLVSYSGSDVPLISTIIPYFVAWSASPHSKSVARTQLAHAMLILFQLRTFSIGCAQSHVGSNGLASPRLVHQPVPTRLLHFLLRLAAALNIAASAE